MSKSKKGEPDWGQFFAKQGALWALVRDTLAPFGVTFLELVPWFVATGREIFVQALTGLVREFVKARAMTQASAVVPIERVRVINKTTIEVNLDTSPILPFDGVTIEPPRPGELHQSGWVTLEKRGDGELYVDGRKVILHLSERQQGGQTINGYQLRYELTDAPVLHPNIMDALLANPPSLP